MILPRKKQLGDLSKMNYHKTDQYLPDIQDIVWINFDPAMGREIKKRRPALVLSHRNYSLLTQLVVIAPITHAENSVLQQLGLLVRLPDEVQQVEGFINPLQFYTLDYRYRNVEYITTLDTATYVKVQRSVLNIMS